MAKEKSGFQGEYNYYVGVLVANNELRFVDTMSNATREATWNAGAEAMPMDKKIAISLQMGLMCNGFNALVIEAPAFQTYRNKEEY